MRSLFGSCLFFAGASRPKAWLNAITTDLRFLTTTPKFKTAASWTTARWADYIRQYPQEFITAVRLVYLMPYIQSYDMCHSILLIRRWILIWSAQLISVQSACFLLRLSNSYSCICLRHMHACTPYKCILPRTKPYAPYV